MQNNDNKKTGRRTRIAQHIAHLAAEFFSIESNHRSMITIIKADVSPNFADSTIYITVLPTNMEEQALSFAKRKRKDFKQYFKQHSNIRIIPFFDFVIDDGEKHRQKIEKISREIHSSNDSAES